jgi:hypothetical protein
MRELANEADHEHRLSRAGVSFYPEQSTWRTIRSAIVRVCELKDAVRLACLAVGRPKESCGGAIDEWQ